MLPIQISMMQNHLLHRGYKNYTVGRMKTWDLIVAYSFEKKQPDSIYLPIRPVSRLRLRLRFRLRRPLTDTQARRIK